MRERSRRRAVRVDFESFVAPEEVAASDSGSDYEADPAAEMDVDGDGDVDLDLAIDADLSPEPVATPSDASDSEKSKPRKAASSRVKPSRAPRAPRAPQRVTASQRAATTQSASRIENLRDRLVLFYGESNVELVRAIKLRAKWSDSLFSVSAAQLEPLESVAGVCAGELQSKLVRLKDDFEASGASLLVDGVRLDPSQQRRSQTAAVLNAGRGVLALDWSPAGSLLVLALRTDTADTINSSTVQPELAPRYEPFEGRSLIHVYEVEGSQVLPYASIEGSDGPVINLQWSQNSYLAAVFATGSVGIFNIESRGSYKLELNRLPRISNAKATCVCWRGNTLVVGYADGLVAEFDVASGPVPSYVVQLHDSVVTSVASGWPNMTSYIFTSGVDGNLKVTDTRDLRFVSKAPRLKHLAPVAAYLPMADSFISLEDANTAKLVPTRHPGIQLALTSVTRHDAGVTAMATSGSHPLLLTGGQDGALHITNPLRRTMATRRKRDLQLDCTIWRLECSHKTSEFRFVELLTVDTLSAKREGQNSMPIFPSSVAITSIAWMPQSTWYAAGSASGLVRVENVDG